MFQRLGAPAKICGLAARLIEIRRGGGPG